MKVTYTNRGFAIINFTDRYGGSCSLQKSSLTTEDCVWLGVDKDADGKEGMRMHLTRGMVKRLMPHLKTFIDSGEIK